MLESRYSRSTAAAEMLCCLVSDSFTSRRATDHEYDAILARMARENGAGEFLVPLPPDFGELIFATSRRSTHGPTLKSKQQSLDCCGHH